MTDKQSDIVAELRASPSRMAHRAAGEIERLREAHRDNMVLRFYLLEALEYIAMDRGYRPDGTGDDNSRLLSVAATGASKRFEWRIAMDFLSHSATKETTE